VERACARDSCLNGSDARRASSSSSTATSPRPRR
jgi:hypothetical protein